MQRREFLRKGLLLGTTALCSTDVLSANSTANSAGSTDGALGICKIITNTGEPGSPPINKYVSSCEDTERSPETSVYPLEIKIGWGLVPLFDPQRGGDMMDRIRWTREQLAEEIGYHLPPVRVRDESSLGETGYRFYIDGQPVAQWSIFPDRYFAISDDKVPKIQGIPVIEPSGAFGLWIDASEREQAQNSGYVVVRPATVIITHFDATVRRSVTQREETLEEINVRLKNAMKRFTQTLKNARKQLQTNDC
ncbi:MAG: flagellar biosynthesis protein FlhA [Planctomycetaceae bacterium]|jgi:flagellar biosynthesis protein FlhA|nr:flagellar biosynthesis protein FlhA [Planctomycetaceae bacterium]